MNEVEQVLADRITRLELALIKLIAAIQPNITHEVAEKLGDILRGIEED